MLSSSLCKTCRFYQIHPPKSHQDIQRDKYYPSEKETLCYLNYFQTCLEGMILNMLFHLENLGSNNFGIWMQILSLRQNDFIKYIKF